MQCHMSSSANMAIYIHACYMQGAHVLTWPATCMYMHAGDCSTLQGADDSHTYQIYMEEGREGRGACVQYGIIRLSVGGIWGQLAYAKFLS